MVAVPQLKPVARQVRLSVERVSKSFSERQSAVEALRDISFEVLDGEFVCIVGPSGCGKSTLLNIIAGLDHPSSGQVSEDGVPVAGPGAGRLMMFQESALFPWLTTIGNVEFGLRLKKELNAKQRREVAEGCLNLVGLSAYKNYPVHQLSGGMRQRVALARALAPNPHILLMDEPFASLDAMTREQLYFDLQRICAEQGKTVVLVTHNIREAACLGDRVFLFASTPGEIKAEFSIGLSRPRDINSVELARYATEITRALKGSSKREVAE